MEQFEASEDTPQAADRQALLLVEDNRADAVLVQHLLRDRADSESYEVVHVSTLSAALHEVQERRFACTLLDLGLPDGEGIHTVGRLKSAAPDMPLVVLTGHDDELLGIEVLRDGAQDYLVKGQIAGRSLSRTIRLAIERSRIGSVAPPSAMPSGSSTVLPFDMSF